MKKILLLVFTVVSFGLFAQNTTDRVQGQPYDWSKSEFSARERATKATTEGGDVNFTEADVQFWVGTGTNKAFLVIEWHDGKGVDALVWGYKWDGDATGMKMISDIAEADPRLIFLTHATGGLGNTIAGLGYDLNRTGGHYLVFQGDNSNPYYPVNGTVYTNAYNYDSWTYSDPNDHWLSGWYTGYWSYWVKDSREAEWGYSGLGASSRKLENGSWDGWSYSDLSGMSGNELSDKFTAATKDINYSKGTFFVNEDWFGHSNGSVNFLQQDGEMVYRAYSKENNNQAFGATTQFGTIYGDNFYFVSKQKSDGGDTEREAGGRLVVANARTLKKIAGFNEIGGGDGRSFLGVNDSVGYIGTSGGVVLFDIKNMAVGSVIAGTNVYNSQVGTMLRIENNVFALLQKVGILVIDANTNILKQTITGTYSTMVQSKDGYLWAATDNSLAKINPYTLVKEDEIALTSSNKIVATWGAWTAGSLCASTKTNTLYWAKQNGSSGLAWFGTQVYRYEIGNSSSLETPFFALPSENPKEVFYGSCLRVDPITDNLMLTTTQSGYGSNYAKNWVLTVDNTGNLLKRTELKDDTGQDYYWFPALPVFPDNYAPTISSADLSKIAVSKDTVISLRDKVLDTDNLSASIVKTLTGGDNSIIEASIFADSLRLSPKVLSGQTTINLIANSNGKEAKLAIILNVISKPFISQQPVAMSLNPSQKVTFTVTAGGGDLSYQWYRNGEAIKYATSASYSISKVKLTDDGAIFYCKVSNGAGEVVSESVTLFVTDLSTSVDGEEAQAADVKAYPSFVPAGQAVSVEINLSQQLLDKIVIDIYSTQGVKIESQKASGQITTINMPYSPGTYILKVRSGTFVKDIKVIVK